LKNCKLLLKDRVQIFNLHYNDVGKHHEGAQSFAFWNLPQLQYKNPNVQVLTYTNLTPSPFVRMICKDGEEIVVDIDGKSRQEIHDHIQKIICTDETKAVVDTKSRQILPNPGYFGWECDRQCMCQVFGQVPCPNVINLPYTWRQKYRNKPDLLEELLASDQQQEPEV